MKKLVLLVCILLLTISLSSCNKNFDETKTDKIYCQIVLSNGMRLNFKLEYDKAPLTVENFITISKAGVLDNTFFHRIIDNFMIQGGGYRMDGNEIIPTNNTKTIKGEFSSNGWDKNDLKHELGVISMARSNNPDSATSQFFVCSSTQSGLDGQYAAFGKTTDKASNENILKLAALPTYQLNYMFLNIPYELVLIKEVRFKNSSF